MVNDPERLVWADVEEAAKLAFKVWVDQPELRWAKAAWELLSKAGMTQFSTELERYEVAIRFVALCDLYLDFCSVAWEEPVESQYSDWADALELTSSFRLAQLLGPVGEINDQENEETLITNALVILAERAREEVFKELEAGFGDLPTLFLSLWQSSIPTLAQFEAQGGDPENYDIHFETSSAAVLNLVTEEKLRAFAWLDEGAYVYRD